MTQRPWSKLQRKTHNIAALKLLLAVANNYMPVWLRTPDKTRQASHPALKENQQLTLCFAT